MRGAQPFLLLALIAASGCTSYLVVAPEPRYAGQEHHRAITSLAGGTGTSPHPGVIASECGAGEQLAMVRLTRNFGQSLLSVVSLGLYAPATAHYFCATPPQPPGTEIDTSGSG